MYTTKNETVNAYTSFHELLTQYIVPTRAEQGNLARYGADSGYSLLCYYFDVESIYWRFENEILDEVEQCVGECGIPAAFVDYARRKRYSGTLGDYLHFLVYTAAESICARVCDDDARHIQ